MVDDRVCRTGIDSDAVGGILLRTAGGTGTDPDVADNIMGLVEVEGRSRQVGRMVLDGDTAARSGLASNGQIAGGGFDLPQQFNRASHTKHARARSGCHHAFA